VTRADLTAHSLATVCPSASALGLGFSLPLVVGPGAWVSVLLGFGLAWLLARVFGEYGARMRAAGSLYTWVAKGLGPAVALTVAVSLALGYAALVTFGLTAAAQRAEAGVSALSGGVVAPTWGATVLLLGLLLSLAVLWRGVRWSTRFAFGAEAAVLSLLVVILVVTGVRGGGFDLGVLSLTGADPKAVLFGAALLMNVTVAFESGSMLGIEADRPFRAVPRSMRDTVLITGVLFLAAVLVSEQARRLGLGSGDPRWRWFAPGAAYSPLDGLALLVLALSFVAMAVCAWTALSRLLFVLSREGLLPRWLGRTNPAGTPHRAVAATLPVVLLPAGVSLAVVGRLGWVAGPLLESATVILFVAYGLAALALPRFLIRLDELTWRTATLAVVTAAGVLAMTVLVIWRDVERRVPSSAALLVAVATLGLLWRASLSGRRRLERIGSHDETRASEVAFSR
jgi:amino acid transporter